MCRYIGKEYVKKLDDHILVPWVYFLIIRSCHYYSGVELFFFLKFQKMIRALR